MCQELLTEHFGLVIFLPTPSRLLCCGRSLWERELTASLVELYFKNRNLLDDLNMGYSVTILTGELCGRYRRTHVYSGAVIHFTFKLQPPTPSRHAACVRCKGALSFHIAKWDFFSSILVFSPFTQGFGVRVQLPLYKQCRQQLVVLPLLPTQKRVVLTYGRLLELVQNA